MAIIRILKGVYGARDSSGRVHPIFKGERVEVSDREALRLTGLSVAEIISGGPAVPPVAPQNGPDPDRLPQDAADGSTPAAGEDGASDGLSVAALERMTKADLEQMAQDMGIDISGAKNNRERAELIAAAEVEGDDDGRPDMEDGDIVR